MKLVYFAKWVLDVCVCFHECLHVSFYCNCIVYGLAPLM